MTNADRWYEDDKPPAPPPPPPSGVVYGPPPPPVNWSPPPPQFNFAPPPPPSIVGGGAVPFWKTPQFKALVFKLTHPAAITAGQHGRSPNPGVIGNASNAVPPIGATDKGGHISTGRPPLTTLPSMTAKLAGANVPPVVAFPIMLAEWASKNLNIPGVYVQPPIPVGGVEGTAFIPDPGRASSDLIPISSIGSEQKSDLETINAMRATGKTDWQIRLAMAPEKLARMVDRMPFINVDVWMSESAANLEHASPFSWGATTLVSALIVAGEWIKSKVEFENPIKVDKVTGEWYLVNYILPTNNNLEDINANIYALEQARDTGYVDIDYTDVNLISGTTTTKRVYYKQDEIRRALDAQMHLRGELIKDEKRFRDGLEILETIYAFGQDIGAVAWENTKKRYEGIDEPAWRKISLMSMDAMTLPIDYTKPAKAGDSIVDIYSGKYMADKKAELQPVIESNLTQAREMIAIAESGMIVDPIVPNSLSELQAIQDEYIAKYGKENAPSLDEIDAEITKWKKENQVARPLTQEEFEKFTSDAVKMVMEAQKLRYSTELHDYTRALTWTREPWRADKFYTALAMFELQIGRPPTVYEIRKIKSVYVNAGTEMISGVLFDVTNIIEPLNIADALIPGMKAARVTFGASLKGAFKEVVQAIPGVSWLTRETLSTVAGNRATLINGIINEVARAYPGNVEKYADDLGRIGQAAAEAAGKSEKEVRAIYDAAVKNIEGMKQVSFSDFMKLRDMAIPESGGIAPIRWAKMFHDSVSQTSAQIFRETERIVARQHPDFTDLQKAKEVERLYAEFMQSPAKMGTATGEFSMKFKDEFLKSHRIRIDSSGRASRLLDDTIFGQIVQKFRLMGDEAESGVLPRVEQVIEANVKYSDKQAAIAAAKESLSEAPQHTKLLTRKQKKVFLQELADAVKKANKMEGGMSFGDVLDNFILETAAKTSMQTRHTFTVIANFLEGVQEIASLIYNFWAMAVLSLNPRWYIQNLVDSTGRSFIYGGNPLEDLLMLVSGTHKNLVDEMGFLPIELGQSLARNGIDFSYSVVGRLLYGDFKPGMGVFSYWKFERDRLIAEGKYNMSNVGGLLKEHAASQLPKSPLQNAIAKLGDGFKLSLKAVPGATSDYNTAIEFTVRLRMFHKEYFKLLGEFDKTFAELGTEAMTPMAKTLAARLWKESGNNGKKMADMVKDIVGELNDSKTIAGRQAKAWSILFNKEIDDSLSALTEAEKQNFLSDMRDNFENMYENLVRNGKKVQDGDVDKLVDDYRDSFRDNVQTYISKSNEMHNMDVMDAVNGKIAKPLTANDITDLPGIIGKATRETWEQVKSYVKAPPPTRQSISANKLKLFEAKSDKLVKNFTEAIPDYAKLTVDDSDTVKVFMGKEGVEIHVGSQLFGKNTREIRPMLSEALVRAIGLRDESMLKSTDVTVDEFVENYKLFIDDPTGLYNRNPKLFVIYSGQLAGDPHLRTVVEKLNKPIHFESTSLISLREDPTTMTGATWLKYQELLDWFANPAPAATKMAGLERKYATEDLLRLLKDANVSDELKNEIRMYVDMQIAADGQLSQFMFRNIPGPGAMRRLKGQMKKNVWEHFHLIKAEEATLAVKRNKEFLKVFKENPEEGLKMLKGFNDNFMDSYLKSMGFSDIQYTETGAVSSFRFSIGNRNMFYGKPTRTQIFDDIGNTKALTEYFFVPEQKLRMMRLDPTVLDTGPLAKGVTPEQQIADAFVTTFGLKLDEANAAAGSIVERIKMVAREAGEDYETFLPEYMKRLKFQRIGGNLTMTDAFEMARSASSEAADEFIFFGYGMDNFTAMAKQMSLLFYDDLRYIAKKAGNGRAVEDFRTLKSLIQELSGRPIIGNNLDPIQAQGLAEVFDKYIATGIATSENKKLFKRFADYLAGPYEKHKLSMSPLFSNVSDDLLVKLDKVYIISQDKIPQSNKRIIQIMASKMGLDKDPEKLLSFINSHAAVQGWSDEIKTSLVDAIEAAGRPREEGEMMTELMSVYARAQGISPEEFLKSYNVFKADGVVDITALYRAGSLLQGGLDRQMVDQIVDSIVRSAKKTELSGGEKLLPQLRSAIDGAENMSERLAFLASIARHDEVLAKSLADELIQSGKLPGFSVLWQSEMDDDMIVSFVRAIFNSHNAESELEYAARYATSKREKLKILIEAGKIDQTMAEKVANKLAKEGALWERAYHGTPYTFYKEVLVEGRDGKKIFLTGTTDDFPDIPDGYKVIEKFPNGRFRTDKMGTGEGAQAFGWGLYLTGNKEIADWYRKTLSFGVEAYYKGEKIASGTAAHAIARQLDQGATLDIIVSNAEMVLRGIKSGTDKWSQAPKMQNMIDLAKTSKASDFKVVVNTGKLYEAEIPDAGYLLWDVPASEQPSETLEAFAKLGYSSSKNEKRVDLLQSSLNKLLEIQKNGDNSIDLIYSINEVKTKIARYKASNGKDLYYMLSEDLGGDELASKALRENGLNGIKFLDASSRSAGEGTFNYVIFDDEAIKILGDAALYQKSGTPMGFFTTSVDPDGSITRNVGLFSSADASTMPHEFAHGVMLDLAKKNDPRIRLIEKAAGVPEGSFKYELKESFDGYNRAKAVLLRPDATPEMKKAADDIAKGFEADAKLYEKVQEYAANSLPTYLKTGKAPTPELKKVFDYFKKVLTDIWMHVRGTVENLPDEAVKFWDSVLTPDLSQVYLPRRYSSLGDVPVDLAKKVFASESSTRFANEMEAAFQVWKLRRGLEGFDPAATRSYDAFKQFLDGKISKSTGEIEAQYRQIMVELEQFADGVATHHYGDDLIEFLNPPVPHAQVGMTAQTVIAQNTSNMRVLNAVEHSLELMRKNWKGMLADDGYIKPMLTKAEKTDLMKWADQAVKNKSEMTSMIVNGGTVRGADGKVIATADGALTKTNKVLLDYQNRNNLDALMKNIFPFWMFPSRSLPFWAQAMVEHPAIMTAYFKIKRASETQRYQAGAVDSSGRPLSSLAGYVMIPGTDLWFNPLAPFSFRYLLDITKYADNNYLLRKEDDDESLAGLPVVVKEFLQSAPILGFNVAPWIGWLVKSQLGISDELIPNWSISPQFNLIPKWTVRWLTERNGGDNFAAHWLFPEPQWQDTLTENKILSDFITKTKGMNPQSIEFRAELAAVNNAIANKGDDPRWIQAYKELTTDDAYRNTAAFFTGVYAKTFTDGQADLISLKLQNKAMREAMNNPTAAGYMGMPVNEEQRWEYYMEKFKYADTPEGWALRLYTDMGWVKNADGDVVNDPAERNKLLAVQMTATEDSRQQYFARKDAYKKLQDDLATMVRVGAPAEEIKAVYDEYFATLKLLNENNPDYQYRGSGKPVALLEQSIRNQWWDSVRSTMPTYDVEKESYPEYEARVEAWKATLPQIAQFLAASVTSEISSTEFDKFYNETTAYLSDRQALYFDPKLIQKLMAETTAQGLEQYRRENDNIFDAANEAWKLNYWNKFWDTLDMVDPEDDARRDLAIADFHAANPVPGEDILYQWIAEIYGDRFTPAQIHSLMINDPYSVEERLDYGKTPEQIAQGEIWDILNWAGPTVGRSVLLNAYTAAGGNENDFTTWYDTEGLGYSSQPEKLFLMRDNLLAAADHIGLTPPTHEELVQRVEASDLNNKFKELATDKFGEDFTRQADAKNGVPPGILAYYYGLTYDDEKLFRQGQILPDGTNTRGMYLLVEQYKGLKKQFAAANPLFAMYYTEYVPIKDQDIKFTIPDAKFNTTPRGGTPSIGKRKFIEREVLHPQSQDNVGSTAMQTQQWQPSQLSIAQWPDGFRAAVGDDIANEIEGLLKQGRWLSKPAKDFLYDFAKRHRQYRAFIYQLLSK